MKKWNIEVNWHGAYGSDEWQVVTDEPFEAENAEDVESMVDLEWLDGCLSTYNELGEVIPVDGAEYRIVEVEDEYCEEES